VPGTPVHLLLAMQLSRQRLGSCASGGKRGVLIDRRAGQRMPKVHCIAVEEEQTCALGVVQSFRRGAKHASSSWHDGKVAGLLCRRHQ